MMRLTTAVLGASMVMWASAAAAQKPDFSGQWTVDTEKTTAANPAMPGGGGGGGRGMGTGPMTIKQDAATLTTERQGGPNGTITATYKLDGTETVTTTQRGEQKNKASWEGTTLVIVTTRPGMDGATMTTKSVYAKEGDWLVVTMTGQMGGNDFTRKTYYKKGA